MSKHKPIRRACLNCCGDWRFEIRCATCSRKWKYAAAIVLLFVAAINGAAYYLYFSGDRVAQPAAMESTLPSCIWCMSLDEYRRENGAAEN